MTRTARRDPVLQSSADPRSASPAVDGLLAGFERYRVPDWDGYGADPISAETLEAANEALGAMKGMIEEPDVAPGADGSIGLEWLFDDGPVRKLFIDIGPGRKWAAYWRGSGGERGKFAAKPVNDLLKNDFRRLLSEAGFIHEALQR